MAELQHATGHRTADATCLVDRQGRIVAADALAEAWLGGLPAGSTLLGDAVAGLRAVQAVADVIEGGDDCGFDATLRGGDSADDRVHLRMRRMEGVDGPLVLVTFQRNAEADVVDALTGLPDRRAIANRVALWRGAGDDSTPKFAVLFLDLDDFKRINDQHGHATGDRVLEAVAQRLVHCVREGDLVARYGGDEFVLLLKDVASVDDAEPVVERLRDCSTIAVDVGKLRLTVGATIGVAIGDNVEQSIEALIAAADRNMYARKRRRPK